MSSYYDRLVKFYGVTDNPKLGGFILPDGSLLDFSEGSGGRSQDHRNINWVSLVPEKPRESRYDVMVRICERVGMYRWMPESWSLEAWTPPTRHQLGTIQQLASMKPIAIESRKGRQVFFREYESYEADEAWQDLLRFYRGSL